MTVWNFLQQQVLGMQWLHAFTGDLLTRAGLDITSRLGGSLHFFLYDIVKISLLLCTLIFLVSWIQSWFPPERSKKILSRFRGLGANTVAALLGTVTPFCSCSSIPLFMGFTGAGLPLGVTFSFLISSPMVDLGSLMLLAGIFGFRIAAVYVLLGLLIAVAGGTLIQKLHMEDCVEPFIFQAAAPDIAVPDLTRTDRLLYARDQVVRTFRKVFPYLLLGVAVGAVIHNWIPEAFIVKLLGSGNPFGVVLATLAGVPMYADIFGTVPIAESLLARGAELGVVLSFMMAVTTLSFPSLVMLGKAIRPRLLWLFAGICTAGIIIVGYVFNALGFLLAA